MKIWSVVTTAAVAAASSYASETAQLAERRVMVCSALRYDPLVRQAKLIATGMFEKASVKIEWHPDDSCPSGAIRITFSDGADPKFLPGALAYALPYEGTHIRVLYDRLKLQNEKALWPHMLAHVLVHEITHILQGVSRHSESGVMKASWGGEDLFEMAFKPLPFTQKDVELIHKGLDKRESRLAAADVAPKPAAQ
jgi:hypothetical protein